MLRPESCPRRTGNEAFTQAPPQQKQIIISNFQNLMNAFLQQSTWFGKLVKACFEPNLVILEELESVPFVNQPPKFLRISLEHFQFQSKAKHKAKRFGKLIKSQEVK